MAGYIGTTPVPQATQHRESFTATGGQTSFATAGYTPQFIDVYLNGVKLAPADYTATNGSDVVLASGATASDILEIVAYTPFEVANQTFTGTTTAANLTVTGAFTSQGIDDNADAVAITIDSSENVGIGTSSPSNYHTGTNLTLFGSGDSGVTIASGTSNASRIHFADGTSGDAQYRGYVVYAHASDSLQIATSGSERMRIDSSGNVGIGTSSVGSETLVVEKSSGTPTIRINAPSGSQAQLKLQADGTVTDTQMIHANTDASLGFSRWDGSAYQERMRIDASGNLLVGTTDSDLTNNSGTATGANLKSNGLISSATNSTSSLELNRLSSDGNITNFRRSGALVGSIACNGGAISIGSDDVGVYFDASSDRILPVNVSTNSVRNDAIDIGSSSHRFKDLYLSGGIQFDSRSNKLDDYEEGTWTPVSDYGTLTSVTATYTKIGNSVFIRLACTMPSTSSSSHMIIQGFPFATAQDGSAQIGYTSSTNYNPAILIQGTICAFYSGSGGAVAASTYSGAIIRFTGQYNTTS